MTAWTPDEDRVLVDMRARGERYVAIGQRLNRSVVSVGSRADRLRMAGDKRLPITRTKRDDDDGMPMRARSTISLAERQRRERERDRVKKGAMRARLVERYLRLTPAQAARLDRHRAHGGFKSTSDLVAALVDKLPDRP